MCIRDRNAGAVQQCKDWIKNFQNKNQETSRVPHVSHIPRVLIISGPEGCGKSLAADLLLKKQGYKNYAFGVKEIKKHKGDKNSLDNFCNLYISDLSELGASFSRKRSHGIVLEDFDGLTKSDKNFNKTIVDLVKKAPSSIIPLIITTTESNLAKQSTGLLRLALVVTFQRLLVKDLVRVALRVANEQQIYLNTDHAEYFAKNAHGDARQMILSMEMFYVGKPKYEKITMEQIALFFECSNVESDEKICMAIEGGISINQSDDERILGMAIGDRGNKRSNQEIQAAIRLVLDNSQQFAPYLFQSYLNCLPWKSDHPSVINTAADIADDMSLGDVMREVTWNFEGHYDLASAVMLENPMKRIRMSHNNDTKIFTVNFKGYQVYYGTENTLQNQLKIIGNIRQMNQNLHNVTDMSDLSLTKELYQQFVENRTDMEIAKAIFPTHPDIIDLISRLKIGRGTFNVTKTRLKKIVKCYEELLETNAPKVKILDDNYRPKQRNKVDTNDPFGLNWD